MIELWSNNEVISCSTNITTSITCQIYSSGDSILSDYYNIQKVIFEKKILLNNIIHFINIKSNLTKNIFAILAINISFRLFTFLILLIKSRRK